MVPACFKRLSRKLVMDDDRCKSAGHWLYGLPTGVRAANRLPRLGTKYDARLADRTGDGDGGCQRNVEVLEPGHFVVCWL